MNTMEIYFSDLTPDAQARLLEAAGISNPKEANWDSDIVPIATVDFESDDENNVSD